MTINQASSRIHVHRPRGLALPGIAGIGYTLSWAAGLSVPVPGLSMRAPGAQVTAAFAAHSAAEAIQFALTEGLPAVGIAVVATALARKARNNVMLAAGLAAATISLVQFVIGIVLTKVTAAHALYPTISHLDGVKMLLLAVLGATAVASTTLPTWLRWNGAALAVTMTVSGVVYLFLLDGLANLAGPALVCVLVFITGGGLALGRKGR